MINAATIAVLVALFAGANVVAAGVTRVLWEFTLTLEGDAAALASLLVVVAAVGAALLFLEGAIPRGLQVLRWLNREKRTRPPGRQLQRSVPWHR